MNASQKRVLIIDFLVVSSTLFGVVIARIFLDENFSYSTKNTQNIVAALVIWLLSLYGSGCYESRFISSGIEEIRRLLKGSATAFLIIGTISFVLKRNPSRLVTFLAFLIGISLLAIARKLLQHKIYNLRKIGQSLTNALVLGTTSYADEMSALLNKNPEYGYVIVGRQAIHSENSLASKKAWLKSIDDSIRDGSVEVLIIEDNGDADPDLISSLSWHLNKQDVEVLIAPTFLKDFGPRLDLAPHSDLPLMFLDEPELSAIEKLTKRTMDLIVASLAIIFLLPVMLFIAIGIFLTNRGPILFIQNRIGLAGEEFRFIKFRTMVVGADKMRHDVLGTPDEDMKNRYKNDPRIYPFGRILRRFSLDEVPQFFSVLSGSMSLVGPRPLLIEELELLGDEDHRRHLTKPGLTGLWQVSGRKETSWDERIQLDLQYVQKWSVGLDFAILLKTIKVVLGGKGSY